MSDFGKLLPKFDEHFRIIGLNSAQIIEYAEVIGANDLLQRVCFGIPKYGLHEL